MDQSNEQYYLQKKAYKNGIYQGYFDAATCQKSGIGIFLYNKGYVYFGEFRNDEIEGEGLIFLKDGGFCHGFFSLGKFQGPVFVKFANGDIVEGYYDQNKLEGTCYKYYSQENEWVKCQFSQGKFQKKLEQGLGLPPSFVFDHISNPKDLVQNFNKKIQQNLPQKVNLIQYNNGGKFFGITNETNQPHGIGIFRYNDGLYDAGNFVQGQLHGFGQMSLQNGDQYFGEFWMGKFCGIGFFGKNGNNGWVFGKFREGQCVQIEGEGKGQIPEDDMVRLRCGFHQKMCEYSDIQQLDVFGTEITLMLKSIDNFKEEYLNNNNNDQNQMKSQQLKDKIFFTLGKKNENKYQKQTNFIKNREKPNIYEVFDNLSENKNKNSSKSKERKYFKHQFEDRNKTRSMYNSGNGNNSNNNKSKENDYVYTKILKDISSGNTRATSSSKKNTSRNQNPDKDNSSILYYKINQAIDNQQKLRDQQKFQIQSIVNSGEKPKHSRYGQYNQDNNNNRNNHNNYNNDIDFDRYSSKPQPSQYSSPKTNNQCENDDFLETEKMSRNSDSVRKSILKIRQKQGSNQKYSDKKHHYQDSPVRSNHESPIKLIKKQQQQISEEEKEEIIRRCQIQEQKDRLKQEKEKREKKKKIDYAKNIKNLSEQFKKQKQEKEKEQQQIEKNKQEQNAQNCQNKHVSILSDKQKEVSEYYYTNAQKPVINSERRPTSLSNQKEQKDQRYLPMTSNQTFTANPNPNNISRSNSNNNRNLSSIQIIQKPPVLVRQVSTPKIVQYVQQPINVNNSLCQTVSPSISVKGLSAQKQQQDGPNINVFTFQRQNSVSPSQRQIISIRSPVKITRNVSFDKLPIQRAL